MMITVGTRPQIGHFKGVIGIEIGVVVEWVVGSSGRWRRRRGESVVAGGGPAEGLREEEERVGEVVERARGVGAAAPVDEEAVLGGIADATLEGDDVAGVELLVLDETAPAFGHDVALAAVPVGVTEAPGFSVTVLEVQDEALVVGGGVQGEVFLCVLLWDD